MPRTKVNMQIHVKRGGGYLGIADVMEYETTIRFDEFLSTKISNNISQQKMIF